MTSTTHVALLHAYSACNSGDGLLVDLSVKLLKEALGNTTRVSIVAADPSSFPQYGDVRAAPVLADRGAARLRGAAGFPLPVGANGRLRDLRRLLAGADLIAGVGGGYLRARHAVEALKLEAGHLLQMRAAKASGKPVVYLPQSIGPAHYAWPMRAQLRGLLASFDSVFVRDDRSLAFLSANPNTRRAPDLAVLEFERRRDAILQRAARAGADVRHVAFVLRRAPAWNRAQRARYAASIARLIERVGAHCRVTFAVQSTGRGNDDAAYYRDIGIRDALVPLRTLLAHDPPDRVVSVRLHGALEAVLQGVPAFHLSYERKGFGAYGDLHLDDWVVNGAGFDPDEAARTILAPGAAAAFWQAARTGLDRIGAARERVIDALRAARQA